jgi:hypothetical protein
MRRTALPIGSKQEFSLPIRDFFNSIGQAEKIRHDQDTAVLLSTADVSPDGCHCRYVPLPGSCTAAKKAEMA